MSREQFKARLEHHEETHGPVEGVAQITLNVVEIEDSEFEARCIRTDDELDVSGPIRH